jgi:hypothetical protein
MDIVMFPLLDNFIHVERPSRKYGSGRVDRAGVSPQLSGQRKECCKNATIE